MARVTTSYGDDNAVHTTLPREAIDLGPRPDFWGDLDRMTKRVQPRPQQQQYADYSAPQQARALRAEGPSMQERAAPAQRPYDPYSGMVLTPRSFGRPQMSQHGVWGTYVNPADVPLQFQGQTPTGFFADDVASNYSYSPLVDSAKYGQPGSRSK